MAMTLALKVPELTEKVARQLCAEQGHDPDAVAQAFTPFVIATPMGSVYVQEKHTHPLWHYWASAAQTAIDAVSSELEEKV